MKVSELIEHLKTLDQDAEIEVGDSQYPPDTLEKESIQKLSDNLYIIYS
ncbi:hypothetical protein ABEY43_07315 [Priestia megaterium]|nr:hypothetical protein [Priestia megaterium]